MGSASLCVPLGSTSHRRRLQHPKSARLAHETTLISPARAQMKATTQPIGASSTQSEAGPLNARLRVPYVERRFASSMDLARLRLCRRLGEGLQAQRRRSLAVRCRAKGSIEALSISFVPSHNCCNYETEVESRLMISCNEFAEFARISRLSATRHLLPCPRLTY